MSSFDALSHEEQLERLHSLATASLTRYDLPDGATANLINLSENATYRINATISNILSYTVGFCAVVD